MKIFLKEEDRILFIKEKLKFMMSVASIVRVKQLPKEIFFITWSFGSEAEEDYCYEIITTDNRKIVCQITTFFDVWIVRSRFYKQTATGYEKMSV